MSSSASAAASAAATAPTGGSGGGGGGVGTSSNYVIQNLGNLGLGYGIAIALGFLVLLSTVLLASYVCCRASRNRSRSSNPNPSIPNDIILPRIIFVAEDDDVDGGIRDGENLVVGLDQTVINSYPKFPFFNSNDRSVGVNSVCSICLCDYKDGEMVRMMPDCHHFFHLCCIDAWLKLNASCPVCRNSPLPTPLSTPLSELVPLSRYPDNRRR